MGFERDRLPDAVSYFENQGLALKGPGKWKTTRCNFHDGSDSMRVNTSSGAWVCMNCGVKGGDVLAYEMQATGVEFVQAARSMGAWVDDGKLHLAVGRKPSPLSPRAALEVLAFETLIVALMAADMVKGSAPSGEDLKRLHTAVGRIQALAGEFQP